MIVRRSAAMKYSALSAALTALSVVLAGCKFSASASGEAKTSGVDSAFDVSSESSAEVANEPPPRAIEYKSGKLEYEGVINFEYDKAQLRDDADTEKTLADFEGFLKSYPDVSLQIEGHTDSRGSDEYNRELSERRAQALREWLVAKGIEESRLTAVGKGESEPQTPEPPECKNKRPVDTSPCEAAWAVNRRVLFSVTGGAEVLEKEQAPAPKPEPEVAAPAPVAHVEECPWLFGPRANALGPNSWITVEGATQPGICWLELSLGLGLGFGNRDATEAASGTDIDGGYWSLTVPLRGRFWFMDRHSLIGDVGLGFTHYSLTGDATAGGANLDYDRSSTPLIGHLGLGYGYRPNGSQAGFRLAAVAGALVHLTDLAGSSINGGFPAPIGAASQATMDNETGDLTDAEPYGELSLSWMF